MRGAALASMMVVSMASAVIAHPTASANGDEPCARVVVPAELSEGWARALTDLRTQVARIAASDCQSMTLSLEPTERGMRIVALTSDGRRTERTVSEPAGLIETVLGLLMTIPEEPSSGMPGGSAAPPAPRVPAPTPPVPPVSVEGAPERVSAKVTVWAGLTGGVRLAAPMSLSAIDIETRADVFLDRWLMLMTLRSAVVSCLGQQGLDCDVYSDVSAGAGVGRRFRLGGPDIDVAFEPSLVVMHMEYDGASGTGGRAIKDTEVAMRLDASARLALPVDRHWVLTVTLDGGLAPSLLTSPARLELPVGAEWGTERPPAFPALSGGVRLGFSGALL